ncbi:MAG: DUF488 domain-containing protein, partial [Myxococcaceae bacterium]|nr:DUF488 domain-containing protein [Myxococcaceae bacterium]
PAGIAYVHFPGLGGRRRPRPDSGNLAWRDTGFRGVLPAPLMHCIQWSRHQNRMPAQPSGVRQF